MFHKFNIKGFERLIASNVTFGASEDANLVNVRRCET